MSKKKNYKRKVTKKAENRINTEPSADISLDEEALASYLSGSFRRVPERRLTDKQEKRSRILQLILKVCMLISACIWAAFMNITAGIGMVIQEKSELHVYGVPMLIETGIILIGVILCLKKHNIVSAAVGLIGIIALFITVNDMCAVVDALALSDNDFQMFSDIYKNRHYPTVCVTVFQFLLCIAQFFSYEEISKRDEIKRKKLEKKYMKAPKILENDRDI